MIIRPASASDVPYVIDLVTSILSKEFPTDQSAYAKDDVEKLMEIYAPPENSFLVAIDDDHVVGTCGIKSDGADSAILRRLFVHSNYRQKGIGLSLLKGALSFCKSRGFREVIIRTSTRMEKAIRLCQTLGFKENGRWTMGQATLIQFHLRLS